MQPAFAAVDWGTTSFRLWLLDRDGRVCGESAGPDGMSRATGLFPEILAAHLGAAGAPAGLPVLICGMAGARQGWVEAPYLPLPARLDRLHEAAIRVPVPGDIRILPGLSQNDPAAPNVMRGEETQLLGLPPSDDTRLVCMPGTHCKWTRMEGGTVTRFTTAMTGELFAALSQHTVLRHSVRQSQTPPDAPAFLAALDLVLDTPASLVDAPFRAARRPASGGAGPRGRRRPSVGPADRGRDRRPAPAPRRADPAGRHGSACRPLRRRPDPRRPALHHL